MSSSTTEIIKRKAYQEIKHLKVPQVDSAIRGLIDDHGVQAFDALILPTSSSKSKHSRLRLALMMEVAESIPREVLPLSVEFSSEGEQSGTENEIDGDHSSGDEDEGYGVVNSSKRSAEAAGIDIEDYSHHFAGFQTEFEKFAASPLLTAPQAFVEVSVLQPGHVLLIVDDCVDGVVDVIGRYCHLGGGQFARIDCLMVDMVGYFAEVIAVSAETLVPVANMGYFAASAGIPHLNLFKKLVCGIPVIPFSKVLASSSNAYASSVSSSTGTVTGGVHVSIKPTDTPIRQLRNDQNSALFALSGGMVAPGSFLHDLVGDKLQIRGSRLESDHIFGDTHWTIVQAELLMNASIARSELVTNLPLLTAFIHMSYAASKSPGCFTMMNLRSLGNDGSEIYNSVMEVTAIMMSYGVLLDAVFKRDKVFYNLASGLVHFLLGKARIYGDKMNTGFYLYVFDSLLRSFRLLTTRCSFLDAPRLEQTAAIERIFSLDPMSPSLDFCLQASVGSYEFSQTTGTRVHHPKAKLAPEDSPATGGISMKAPPAGKLVCMAHVARLAGVVCKGFNCVGKANVCSYPHVNCWTVPKTKVLKLLKTFASMTIVGYTPACQAKVLKFVEDSFISSLGVPALDAVRTANASL